MQIEFPHTKSLHLLIHNGFCGQESEDEENKEQEEEDNKYFEDDGCGMGEGKGQENVSDQIQDEE